MTDHTHSHAHPHADDWHSHSAEEGSPQEEHLAQVNAFKIIQWMVGLGILLILVIAALWVYFDNYRVRLVSQRAEVPLISEYSESREKAEAALSAAGKPRTFTPLAEGRVQIPIDDAMKKIATSYEKGARSLGATLPKEHSPIR